MKATAAAPRARLAVLLSGRGSNFVALAEALARGEAPADIVVVASNVEAAPGLARARGFGIPTVVLPHSGFASRGAHEAALLQALREARADWICLAGYMRLLSPEFVAAYAFRILNIHPSLLPAFPGLHPQRQALAAGVRVSGCTVHLVDGGLDSGPIVVQRPVPVEDGDDEETLAARILAEEHRAYVLAVRRLLTESWIVDGRRLRFLGAKPRGRQVAAVPAR
ncbi:MAG: phosphoribosylglycinamide formyltransferase [Thermoanaerobaculia bacterium]|nr:phosphoribosylglycinamide formyltransferase [Thermoanaerobaculia bacterium]MBP9823571.1 phosphoribosylglycinamide formyltransferase [Thermoanaerobaculia bacterium]